MNLMIETKPVPLRIDSDGVIRVGGTRVTLDTLVEAFQDGASAEEIAYQYPSLALADVYAVIAFFLNRRPEVEIYLAERRRMSDDVRRENESRNDPRGVRDRLLARRHQFGG